MRVARDMSDEYKESSSILLFFNENCPDPIDGASLPAAAAVVMMDGSDG